MTVTVIQKDIWRIDNYNTLIFYRR